MLPRRAALAFVAWLTFGALLFVPSGSTSADEAEGGLSAAKEPLGKLAALAIKDGYVTLDQESWEKNREKEPEDPEEAKKWRKAKVAKRLGLPVEQINDPDACLKLDAQWNGGGAVQYELFNEVMSATGTGTGGGIGGGRSNTRSHWDAERTTLKGHVEYDTADHSFVLKLSEKAGAKRIFALEEEPLTGLTLRLEKPLANTSLLFTCASNGAVALISRREKESVTLSGENMDALLKSAPDKVQIHFLHPLADLGIVFPPSPYLPTVMAAATSGFGAAAPKIAKHADKWITKLNSDDGDAREEATRELIQLFPLAVRHILKAAEQAKDPESKARLSKASGAHPNIAKALAYVEKEKLHENRAYLLDIMAHVPFFKTAARTRLAELHGKD